MRRVKAESFVREYYPLYKIIFNYAVSSDAIITRVTQTNDRGKA